MAARAWFRTAFSVIAIVALLAVPIPLALAARGGTPGKPGDSIVVRVKKPAPSPSPTATETSTPSPTPSESATSAGKGDLSTGSGSIAIDEPLPSPLPEAFACAGIALAPGANLQAAIDANGSGATFCLAAGTYRLTSSLSPKSGQRFIGAPGAVLNGSRLLASFTASGGLWAATGQTQESTPKGSCSPSAYAGCKYNEAVFADDQPLWRVMSKAEVVPGTFFFDYGADTIWLGADPAGHRVEAAVAPGAFTGSSSRPDVTIRGLVIEKFANAAQRGAIHASGASGWVVEDNEVRLNHGAGISTNSNSVVRGNDVHHNGQLGLHSSGGSNMLVEANEIAFNNWAGFSYGWEAGGTKWVKTDGLTVRGNYSHDNKGPGLWTDIDNINTVYEGNVVEDNVDAGIFHEISYDAVIRDNTIRRNGYGRGDWLWGSGIQIAASPNVEVYGNVLEDNANSIGLIQQNRGSGAYGAHQIHDVDVHDNAVTMRSGATGMVQDIGDTSYFTDRNVLFRRNAYLLGSSSKPFRWQNRSATASEWRGYGNDVTGSFGVAP